jgi:hypothetical protein
LPAELEHALLALKAKIHTGPGAPVDDGKVRAYLAACARAKAKPEHEEEVPF